MEKTGIRFEGYHIALYACAMGELGECFLGYCRIFTTPPKSYWDPGHVVEAFLPDQVQSVEEAFEAAEKMARLHIMDLAQRGKQGNRQHGDEPSTWPSPETVP